MNRRGTVLEGAAQLPSRLLDTQPELVEMRALYSSALIETTS